MNHKTFIFGCNNSESTLAGTEQIIQRYPIFGHPRVVEIKQKARPRYTLNNLKDDRIFLFPINQVYPSPEDIIPGSHGSTHQSKQLASVTQVSITNKQGGATSSLKPSDMMSDRQPGLKLGFFLLGGRGKPLFLRSLISFSPASRFNFNCSIS